MKIIDDICDKLECQLEDVIVHIQNSK
ncbi:hypothetical protein [Paenibacillus sp. QZ-Y1]